MLSDGTAQDASFLISESVETLQKFIENPKGFKVETLIATVELISGLVKRLESIPLHENGPPRSGIDLADPPPRDKIALLPAILRGEFHKCPECHGWRDITE